MAPTSRTRTARLSAVVAASVCVWSALAGGVDVPLPAPIHASKYVAPEGRNAEMQAYDKAVLFLSALQEPDGHWDAAKCGAAPEFAGINGDILATAQATYVMLLSSSGKFQNREAIARAKRGTAWLQARIQPDGRIANEQAVGAEPVFAQLFTAMTLLQAASMSTRPALREAALVASRHAVLKMPSPNGGFGAAPKAADSRADTTAVATLLYKTALMEEAKFSDAAIAADARKEEAEIEKRFKTGVLVLLASPEKKDGLFSMSSADLKPDWNATVCAVLARMLLLATLSEMRPALNFIGYDDSLKTRLAWGKEGEGYQAMTLWLGTVSNVYLFSENSKEGAAWTRAARDVLLKNQSADGGWAVAGPDALRGKVWRASLQALTLILLAPPPPPPAPPPCQ